MSKEFESEIFAAVKEEIERIESERYNSKNPVLVVTNKDSTKDIVIKILSAERMGAPLKIHSTSFNPAEDLAKKNLSIGKRALNSWQFRKSMDHLSLAAIQTTDKTIQQKVNLYKQLNKLLKAIIQANPERAVRNLQPIFKDIRLSIEKYDLFDKAEQQHYLQLLDLLFNFVEALTKKEVASLTHQLLARCSISLMNSEYLAAYIWLFKIYLLNKDSFTTIANKNERLKEVLVNLKEYLSIETGLSEELDDSPTIAKSGDLRDIFIDLLTEIYDVNFLEKTKEILSFPPFKST
ncbi:MAG: hypothetical protein ACTSXO_11630 [Candidatus Heimdallarchaeota archaeon]